MPLPSDAQVSLLSSGTHASRHGRITLQFYACLKGRERQSVSRRTSEDENFRKIKNVRVYLPFIC